MAAIKDKLTEVGTNVSIVAKEAHALETEFESLAAKGTGSQVV